MVKVLLKIILLVVVLVSVSIFWPVHEWMQALIGWVRDSGTWGVLVYAVVYIVAILLLIPGSLLTLGAGFVYGPLWGTLLVSPVSVTGAYIAFCLARGRLRPWVAAKVRDNPRFDAVDQAVGAQGFKIVTLLRLSPVFPFTLLNYALGLTGVTAGKYVLASFIGMLPATFLYTYLGSLVPQLSELAAAPDKGAAAAQNIFLWGGFGMTVIVTLYVTRLARRALAAEVGKKEKA